MANSSTMASASTADSSSTTRLLFLPYFSSVKVQPCEEPNRESRQKHAAREYHRRKRLQKEQSSSKPEPGSRAVLERHKSRPTDPSGFQKAVDALDLVPHSDQFVTQNDRNSLRLVGKWRADPFNVFCTQDVPEHVQEMLDHGMRIKLVDRPLSRAQSPGFPVEPITDGSLADHRSQLSRTSGPCLPPREPRLTRSKPPS